MKCEYCKTVDGGEHRTLGVICDECYYNEADRRARFDRYVSDNETLFDDEVA